MTTLYQMLVYFTSVISPITKNSKIGTISLFILYVKKVSKREIRWTAHGNIAKQDNSEHVFKTSSIPQQKLNENLPPSTIRRYY